MARVLKPFEYCEPKTIEEAINILSTWGGKTKVLAGGVDIVGALRRREIEVECIVSIQKIPYLNYIEEDSAGGLRIGALTTLRTIELSPIVCRHYLLLSEAIGKVSSIQVKTMGTAVGNLCVATPASDIAPPMIALGAELKIASLGPLKTIPIESFFVGVKKTILQPMEIVTEISIPPPPPGTGGAFLNLLRTASDIAKVSVAVIIVISDSTCLDAKIVLGAVAATPIRATKAEETIKGQTLDTKTIEKAADIAAEEAKPISDIRSTAEYRREMTKVLVKKALEKALERAKGELT